MRDSGVQMARHEQNKNVLQHAGKNAVATVETTALSNSNTAVTKRWLLFAGWIVLSSLLFTGPLVAFVRTSLSNDDASYLVLIPFLSAWIMFRERRIIVLGFSDAKLFFGGSLLFLAGGVALAFRVSEAAQSP